MSSHASTRHPTTAGQALEGGVQLDVRSSSDFALRRLLVATDTSGVANGALRMADLLARRSPVAVDLLTVFEPPAPLELPNPAGTPVEKLNELADRARTQLRAVVGERPGWHLAVESGPAAETIVASAAAREADLVLIGLARRRFTDRLLDSDTALAVARLATAPVLAVPPRVVALPSTVMLALDFGTASIRAAGAALDIMQTPGVMHLVYVHTDYEPFPSEPDDAAETYAAGFASFFDALELELGQPAGVTFERVVLRRGDPASELLAYASANGIDMIAAGNHGKSMRERLRLGSVSTRLIRSAQCPVLVSSASPTRMRRAPLSKAATTAARSAEP